ncbi:MAG TPA: DUF2680 domain-containing protein [Mogibacterium sp.]|nr:DUF2680 domain-containing protein [Mogibacterium sp.]
MKKIRKLAAAIVATLVLTSGSITAFAGTEYSTPAELVAGLLGKSVEEVVAEKIKDKTTYGAIAADAGKLEEFKAGMLKIKKDRLSELVKAGKITQEKADSIMKAIEENQSNCDGTGSAKIGKRLGSRGMGFGNGSGQGAGQSQERKGQGGNGQGSGRNMN